jgi:hypothetical protein
MAIKPPGRTVGPAYLVLPEGRRGSLRSITRGLSERGSRSGRRADSCAARSEVSGALEKSSPEDSARATFSTDAEAPSKSSRYLRCAFSLFFWPSSSTGGGRAAAPVITQDIAGQCMVTTAATVSLSNIVSVAHLVQILDAPGALSLLTLLLSGITTLSRSSSAANHLERRYTTEHRSKSNEPTRVT